MALEDYRRKRSFAKTPEPQGSFDANSATINQWRFVVQKHAASRLHYDLRLELNGVLLSWAIPKGPSLDWEEKRLSIHVEDHPIEYLEFEGLIPRHEYGGGTVMVWDRGTWKPRHDAVSDYQRGELKFHLAGSKLRGGWMLKRLDRRDAGQWLLIKEKDESMRDLADFDVLEEMPNSVLTDRSIEEIAADRDAWWSGNTARLADWKFDANKYPEAQECSLPETVRPSLPTAARVAPTGEQWIHEIKHDGYRMICHLHKGEVRFQSRNGKDWTDRLASLSRLAASLQIESVVFDGEIVVIDEAGRTSFQALQNRIGVGGGADLRYFIFDLLYVNGYSLTSLPLLQRKQILDELMQSTVHSQRFMYTDHIEGDGPTIFQQACQLGVEGIVSKRADKRYSEGRTEFWYKTKCLQSREFLIGGFTMETNSRQRLGAILLGIPDEDGKLHFAGKIGTGFTEATLTDLRSQLGECRISKSPFVNLDRRTADKGTLWVEPELVVEIEFAGWTREGLVRFGSFRGIREDLTDADLDSTLPGEQAFGDTTVNGEDTDATPAKSHASSHAGSHVDVGPVADVRVDPRIELPEELSSVRLTSPDRIVYPDMGITKLGVATFYAQAGKWMLPHVVGRPVSLLRCPNGVADTCFFQKRAPQGLHDSVERLELPGNEGGHAFLVVHDLVGLLSLVQFGVLEFHVSGARFDRFDRPDRLVFDLDPDQGLPFEHTVSAARELRTWLHGAGLESFLKTTGGKGLHIVVPIRRRHTWGDVRKFTTQVAADFERRHPRRFTSNPSRRARRGRILIDALRNTRGATTVAAFSTRARATASVSVPIAWEELDGLTGSDSMSLQAVLGRLAAMENDPWSEIGNIEQGLTRKAWNRLGN